MQKISYLFILLLFNACAADAPLDFPNQATAKISKTSKKQAEGVQLAATGHQKAVFQKKETIAFDIQWSNRKGLKAHLVQRPDGSAIYIQYASGTQAWWDSRKVHFSPVADDTITQEQARFDLRAWHYWSCLPYKLDNPGAHWQELPDRTLDGQACAAGRLSFDPGTGDTPDDWFAVFIGRKDKLVHGAAYVATFGYTSAETAAKSPNMIRYNNYQLVDGIPIAQRWSFKGWNTEGLGEGTPLGEAVLSNIRFDAGIELLKGE